MERSVGSHMTWQRMLDDLVARQMSARLAPPGEVPSEEALDLFVEGHRVKLDVCDSLEVVADQLPDAIDHLGCINLASALVPLLRSIHAFEERTVFEAYSALEPGSARVAASINRLRSEHVEDQCFADEVTAALMKLGRGRAVGNAEEIGFMLRGFFETMRRHVAFEREHLLPILSAHRVG